MQGIAFCEEHIEAPLPRGGHAPLATGTRKDNPFGAHIIAGDRLHTSRWAESGRAIREQLRVLSELRVLCGKIGRRANGEGWSRQRVQAKVFILAM